MSTTGNSNNNHPVAVACEHCQQSFPSRNLLFKHLRDDSSSCVPDNAALLIAAAPSVQKRLEKKRKHAEFRSRTKRPTTTTATTSESTTTTTTTTTTILSLNAQRQKSQDCCLWFGDIPLAWTRHGGKYKRFRALLRYLLPDDIPDPWIQHVQRKAYRIKKKEDINNSNNDNDQQGQKQQQQDDGGDDDGNGDCADDNGNHDATTTTRNNNNSNSSSSNNYVGYAIIAFRDQAECRTVETLLDGVEVKVEDVFNERDVGSSQDFHSFRQSKTPPFILRVKAHQPRSKKGKQAAASATLSSSSTGDEPETTSLPLSAEQEETNDDDVSPTTLPPSPTAAGIRLDAVDPPLVDLFRPLTTAELCQRIMKKRSGTIVVGSSSGVTLPQEAVVVVDAATISHEEALQLAVDTYERVGIARPVVRSQGREIPASIRNPLLHVLKHLRWAVPNHRQGISVERYLVLLTKVVVGGNNNTIEKKKDAVYGDLRDACKTLMDWADPTYYYSGIAVTKNFCGSPHIDHRDRNFQYAVSFLDNNETAITGGELCVDGTDENGQEVIHVVTTTNRIAAIDGRHVHWVRPWTAGLDRYSLIFYDTSCEEERPRLPRGVM